MDILDPNVDSRCVPAIIVEMAYDAVANFTRCGGTSNIFYYGYDATKELCYNRLGVTISKEIYFAVLDTLQLFGSSGDTLTIRSPFTEEPTFTKVSAYAMTPEEAKTIVIKIEDSKED